MPFFMLLLIAAVQGITEFLPVSSSGHLVLIPLVTDPPYQGRTIDVAAHVGTLIAVAAYLRADLLRMARGLLTFGRRHSTDTHLGLLIVIATLPVISVGYFVNKVDPAWLLNLETLAIANLVFALLLWLADKFGATARTMGDLKFNQAVLIGLAQIFALIPGASRSGVTMMAARYLGFGRLTAARFSLLLSLPTIAGAGVLKTYDLVQTGDLALGADALIVSALSCLFAFAAIDLMMRWLARADFTIFVGYRLALGIVLLVVIQTGYL
mgnify:FL=1